MPSADQIDCSIVIPHFNDVVRLERCLEALMPQVGADVEVIVADNNSTQSLDAVTSRWPEVRVTVETEKGAGPNRNTGVAEAKGRWLLFIDSDCVPASDWVARGREIARENAIIGGRVDIFHETPPPCSGAEAFEAVFAFKMKRYLQEEKFLGAGNLVLAKATFDKVGGFRAAVAEDREWSQRAASMGVELDFDDDFAASHPSRQNWDQLQRKWRRLASEAYHLDVHEAGDRVKWAVKALAMPASAVVHAPQVLRHPDLNMGEKLRGLATLFRIRFYRMAVMLGQAASNRP